MVLLTDIIGQEHIIRLLQKALKQGRIVHGYLLAGLDGLGKRTTGEAMAAALLCAEKPMEGCGNCLSCRRVTSGNHPDFHRLRADGTQIGIDAVRQLQQELSLQPYESRFKVALIEEADRMTAAAANSLLKFLEEPVGSAVIILTANNLAQILPTIVSRCQVYRFHPVPTEELAQVLTARGVPQDEALKRSVEARGITGRALADEQQEHPWSLAGIAGFCDRLLNAGADWLFRQTDGWTYDAAAAEHVLRGLEDWFRIILLYKATGQTQIPSGPLYQQMQRQASRFDEGQLVLIQELIGRAKHALSLHVNVRLTLDALLLKIQSLAADR